MVWFLELTCWGRIGLWWSWWVSSNSGYSLIHRTQRKKSRGGSHKHEDDPPMDLHFTFSAHQTLLGHGAKTRKDLSPSWNPLLVGKPWEQPCRQPGIISWKMTLQIFFQYFYFSSPPFETLRCVVMAFTVHYSIQLYSTLNPIITTPNTSKFTCSPCRVWWLFFRLLVNYNPRQQHKYAHKKKKK